MAKANVYAIDGTVKSTMELPSVFATEFRPVIIKRAALALQTTKKQPKGNDQRAGKMNTALYVGYRGVPAYRRTINVEHARLPRLQNRGALLYGRVAAVPNAVGGTRAHGLKAWETIVEKINKKERRLALKSAIGATTNKKLVEMRFIVEKELPIIVEDKLEEIAKTAEVLAALEKVGVGKDLENARGKIRKRAGRGKSRGRTWKEKKSVLIITGKNSPVLKASRNLPGVDAVTVASLNVDLLAPGAEAGRLVVYTKSAVEELGKEVEDRASSSKDNKSARETKNAKADSEIKATKKETKDAKKTIVVKKE
jgi:large subunit ribosomal protein L4e